MNAETTRLTKKAIKNKLRTNTKLVINYILLIFVFI